MPIRYNLSRLLLLALGPLNSLQRPRVGYSQGKVCSGHEPCGPDPVPVIPASARPLLFRVRSLLLVQ
jgi:hypothetical protein